MTHPARQFRPVGKRATKIPRRGFNRMGRVSQKASNLGLPGYETEDALAYRAPISRQFKLVEVIDSYSNYAGVLNYDTVSGAYTSLPGPEYGWIPEAGDWNRGSDQASSLGTLTQPYDILEFDPYGGETGSIPTGRRLGPIYPRFFRMLVMHHGPSGAWVPATPPPPLLCSLDYDLNIQHRTAIVSLVEDRWAHPPELGVNTAVNFAAYFFGWQEMYWHFGHGGELVPKRSLCLAEWIGGHRHYSITRNLTFGDPGYPEFDSAGWFPP